MISRMFTMTLVFCIFFNELHAATYYCPYGCQNGGTCGPAPASINPQGNLSMCTCANGFSGAYCQFGSAPATAAPTVAPTAAPTVAPPTPAPSVANCIAVNPCPNAGPCLVINGTPQCF